MHSKFHILKAFYRIRFLRNTPFPHYNKNVKDISRISEIYWVHVQINRVQEVIAFCFCYEQALPRPVSIQAHSDSISETDHTIVLSLGYKTDQKTQMQRREKS